MEACPFSLRLRAIDFKIFVDPSRSVKGSGRCAAMWVKGLSPCGSYGRIFRVAGLQALCGHQKIYAEILVKIQDSRFHPLFSIGPPDRYSVPPSTDAGCVPGDLTVDLSKI
jgi:hypothetical protein